MAIKLPGILRLIGKKQIEQGTQWIPSAAVFGITAGVALSYATDWKTVLQFLPYYNGKYKEE